MENIKLKQFLCCYERYDEILSQLWEENKKKKCSVSTNLSERKKNHLSNIKMSIY